MSRRQLNITLKEVSETDDKKNTANETRILKINSNDKYCMISSITKLQKAIDAALDKTKWINFKLRSSDVHRHFIRNALKKCLNWI